MIIDMPTVSMGNTSGSIVPADKVSYDNTTSDLEAENVQDAVDEIVSGIQECTLIDSYEYVEGNYSVQFYKYSNGMKYVNARKNNTAWGWGTTIFQIPNDKLEWCPKADMTISCILVGQNVPICSGNFTTTGLINASVPTSFTGSAIAFGWYI